MKLRMCLLLVALAWCAPAFSIDEDGLAKLLEDARVEMKMPGLRAAVRMPDGDIVRAAVGLADKEADTPLNDTIGMPGGSTGKTFVAALTMLLVEDGTPITQHAEATLNWLINVRRSFISIILHRATMIPQIGHRRFLVGRFDSAASTTR